jgi:aryl-alcohol dehydrogenase-like predicted oxidoreductase
MTFGSPVAEVDAIRLTHAAIDLGINFIDTANVYEGYARYLGSPGGVAEEIVGKALRDRRDRVILATKVAAPVGPGPQDRGLSAVHILRELDRSLKRLQTDVIDLYIIHWPDKCVPLEVTLRAIDTAVQQGKIRYFGASNHSAWQLCEMLWLADRNVLPRVVSSQIPCSLLRRELHNDLTFCQQHGIGVTPYQSLQGGLLTGKYRRGPPPPADSRAAEKPDWVWKQDDALFDRLEAVADLAAEADGSVRVGLDADAARDEFADCRREVDRADRGRRRCGERPHSRRTFLPAGCDLPSALATARSGPRDVIWR